MQPTRAVEIVTHVVFACPYELYRQISLLRDHRRFGHEVICQAAAKPAANARNVDVNVLAWQSRDYCRST